MLIGFEQFNVRLSQNSTSSDGSGKRKNCTDNFLELYDGTTSISNRKFHLCSNENNKYYKSETNQLYIRFMVKKYSNIDIVYFRITFNPFKLGIILIFIIINTKSFKLNNLFKNIGPCSNDSFRCSDDTCIDTRLICDGKRNCINSEDETSCRQLLLVNKNKDKG